MLFFCVVTLATVGYGDFTPTTPFTKLFPCFSIMNGIGILLFLCVGRRGEVSHPAGASLRADLK